MAVLVATAAAAVVVAVVAAVKTADANKLLSLTLLKFACGGVCVDDDVAELTVVIVLIVASSVVKAEATEASPELPT